MLCCRFCYDFRFFSHPDKFSITPCFEHIGGTLLQVGQQELPGGGEVSFYLEASPEVSGKPTRRIKAQSEEMPHSRWLTSVKKPCVPVRNRNFGLTPLSIYWHPESRDEMPRNRFKKNKNETKKERIA